ncbi:DMT family transporter [Halopiger thermotolerans]
MSKYKNIALFLVLSIIWGGSYISIKAGLAYLPPATFAAIRYDIASIIMIGYVAFKYDYWYPRTKPDFVVVAIGSILIIAAYNYLIFIGEQSIPGAVAGILVGLNPIFATILSRVLLPDERLDTIGVVGLLLGFAGVALIARPTPSTLFSSDIIGKTFVLGAAACLGGGSVLTQLPADKQPVLTMEAWSMGFGAMLLHIAAFIRPGDSLRMVDWTSGAVVNLLYLAVLSSAVAYFIYFDLLDRLGPIEINLVAYAAAAFGAVIGWIVLQEQLDILTLVGLGTIFGGFLLVKRREVREELLYASWIPVNDPNKN